MNRHNVPVGKIFRRKFERLEEIEDNAFEFFFLPAGSHRNSFGLVADGVNRTGKLIDGRTQCCIQKIKRVDQVLFRVEFLANVLQRQLSGGIFEQEQQIGNSFTAQNVKSSSLTPGFEQDIEVVDQPAERDIGDHVQDIKNG